MKKKLLSVLLTLVMLVPGFGSFSVVASAENYVAQVIDLSLSKAFIQRNGGLLY